MKDRMDRREFMGSSLMLAGGASLLGTGVASAQPKGAAAAAGGAQRKPLSEQGRPLVIDLHVHMSQPPVETAYRDVLFKPFKAQYDGDGKRHVNPKRYTYLPEEIIERMNDAAVDVSFVMMGGSRRRGPGRADSYDFIAQQIEKYPGRLVGMPTYDPLYEPYRHRDFVDMVADMGFKAVKLLAPYEQYNPYNDKIWPFYKRASERDISVTFHTGWPPVAAAPIYWANIELEGVDELGARFPDLKVHLAHAGGPHQWQEAVLVTAKHDNFSLDFSSWGAYPPQQLIAMIGLARDVGGIEKVMFGSEHSVCDPAMMVAQIRNLNLWAERFYYAPFTDEEIRRILGLNAAAKWNLSTALRM